MYMPCMGTHKKVYHVTLCIYVGAYLQPSGVSIARNAQIPVIGTAVKALQVRNMDAWAQ